jgi:hypothetical protein
LHWRFGLARRSRIVRVNNHQIGFISTHRKIGHSPSIKWYLISRLIGEFNRVFSIPIVPKTLTKFFTLSQQPLLASHFHSISVVVEFACLIRFNRCSFVVFCFLVFLSSKPSRRRISCCPPHHPCQTAATPTPHLAAPRDTPDAVVFFPIAPFPVLVPIVHGQDS